MSSKAGDGLRLAARDRTSRSGFLLAEVLVAFVVAGLFLGVLSGAFSLAWSTARSPMEVMSAVAVARAGAADTENEGIRDSGQIGGYSFARSSGPVSFEERPSQLAPAPRAASSSSPTTGARSGAPILELRRITVLVRAPSGRRVSLDAIRLHAPTR